MEKTVTEMVSVNDKKYETLSIHKFRPTSKSKIWFKKLTNSEWIFTKHTHSKVILFLRWYCEIEMHINNLKGFVYLLSHFIE